MVAVLASGAGVSARVSRCSDSRRPCARVRRDVQCRWWRVNGFTRGVQWSISTRPARAHWRSSAGLPLPTSRYKRSCALLTTERRRWYLRSELLLFTPCFLSIPRLRVCSPHTPSERVFSRHNVWLAVAHADLHGRARLDAPTRRRLQSPSGSRTVPLVGPAQRSRGMHCRMDASVAPRAACTFYARVLSHGAWCSAGTAVLTTGTSRSGFGCLFEHALASSAARNVRDDSSPINGSAQATESLGGERIRVTAEECCSQSCAVLTPPSHVSP